MSATLCPFLYTIIHWKKWARKLSHFYIDLPAALKNISVGKSSLQGPVRETIMYA